MCEGCQVESFKRNDDSAAQAFSIFSLHASAYRFLGDSFYFNEAGQTRLPARTAQILRWIEPRPRCLHSLVKKEPVHETHGLPC